MLNNVILTLSHVTYRKKSRPRQIFPSKTVERKHKIMLETSPTCLQLQSPTTERCQHNNASKPHDVTRLYPALHYVSLTEPRPIRYS